MTVEREHYDLLASKALIADMNSALKLANYSGVSDTRIKHDGSIAVSFLLAEILEIVPTEYNRDQLRLALRRALKIPRDFVFKRRLTCKSLKITAGFSLGSR